MPQDDASSSTAQSPLTNINAQLFADKITYAYLDEVDRRWPKDVNKLAPSSSSSTARGTSSKRPRSPSRNRVSSSTSKSSSSKSDTKSDSKGDKEKETDKSKKSDKEKSVDKESAPPPTKKAKGEKGEAVPTASESESEKKDAKTDKSEKDKDAKDKSESSKKDADNSSKKVEEKKPEPKKYVKPVFKYDARFMLDCCGMGCHKAAQRYCVDSMVLLLSMRNDEIWSRMWCISIGGPYGDGQSRYTFVLFALVSLLCLPFLTCFLSSFYALDGKCHAFGTLVLSLHAASVFSMCAPGVDTISLRCDPRAPRDLLFTCTPCDLSS